MRSTKVSNARFLLISVICLLSNYGLTGQVSSDPPHKLSQNTLKIDALIDCANKGRYTDIIRAHNCIGQAKEVALLISDSLRLIKILKIQGDIFMTKDENSNALSQYEQSLNIAEQLGNYKGKLTAMMNIGSCFAKMNQIESAIKWYDLAIDSARNEIAKVSILLNKASVYSGMDKHDKVIEIAQKAENLLLKRGNQDPKKESLYRIMLSKIYNLMGNSFRYIKDYNNSITYFKTGLQQYDNIPTANKGLFYNNIANVLMDTDQLDSALFYLEKTINSKNIPNATKLYSFSGMANVYMKKKEYATAYKYLKKRISSLRNENLSKSDINMYAMMGKCCYYTQKYDEAIFYLSRAEQEFITMGNKFRRSDTQAYLVMSKLSRSGEHDLSNTLYSSYELRDSIYQQDLAVTIEEAKEKYETEKKELQNQVLQSENLTKQATIQKQQAYLAGSILGISGLSFGLYYLFQRNKKEKELHVKDVVELKANNQRWYDKVQRAESSKKKVSIDENDRIYLREYDVAIPINDILRIQSDGNYVRIYTSKYPTGYHIRNTLASMKSEYLPDIPFVRINHKTVVNMNYITRKSAQKIHVNFGSGELEYNVGRKYKEEFFRLYDLMPEKVS